MSPRAFLIAAIIGLTIVPSVSNDAFAFQRSGGGGGHAFVGGRSFGGGFGGQTLGRGFVGRGGYRGYGHYAGYGHYGRGYRYGYGYPGYYGYGDGGAVAGAVIGSLALGALAAAAGGY